jgi:hypothetical protein
MSEDDETGELGPMTVAKLYEVLLNTPRFSGLKSKLKGVLMEDLPDVEEEDLVQLCGEKHEQFLMKMFYRKYLANPGHPLSPVAVVTSAPPHAAAESEIPAAAGSSGVILINLRRELSPSILKGITRRVGIPAESLPGELVHRCEKIFRDKAKPDKPLYVDLSANNLLVGDLKYVLHGVRALMEIARVEVLDLSYNRIRGISEDSCTNLEQLAKLVKFLVITQNPVASCHSIKWFEKLMEDESTYGAYELDLDSGGLAGSRWLETGSWV